MSEYSDALAAENKRLRAAGDQLAEALIQDEVIIEGEFGVGVGDGYSDEARTALNAWQQAKDGK